MGRKIRRLLWIRRRQTFTSEYYVEIEKVLRISVDKHVLTIYRDCADRTGYTGTHVLQKQSCKYRKHVFTHIDPCDLFYPCVMLAIDPSSADREHMFVSTYR